MWSLAMKLDQAVCKSSVLPVMFHLMMLSSSGEVFKGSWNKTEVALKVLKSDVGVAPSSAVRYSQVSIS